MDNQDGTFKKLSEYEYKKLLSDEPDNGFLPSLFRVGEELKIKNSTFRVSHVDNDGKGSGRLILKLLPQ